VIDLHDWPTANGCKITLFFEEGGQRGFAVGWQLRRAGDAQGGMDSAAPRHLFGQGAHR